LPDIVPSHSKFLTKPSIIHQVIYGKENTNESYHHKRLLTQGDSSERAKRAASVSNSQTNKQFLSKRGSNTLKTLSKLNKTSVFSLICHFKFESTTILNV